MPAPERKILLIEDYDALALAIESALKKFAPQHRVEVVSSLAAARAAARENRFELIILDFDPPHPSAITFFQELRETLPETRVLVIASERQRGPDHSRAALQFLEKPFELVDFGAAVQALLGPWSETGTSRGTLRDFGVADAVALGCLAGTNAMLEVRTANNDGDLHFENGQLNHAATESEEGKAALAAMVSWEKPRFSERKLKVQKKRTIDVPWTAVLRDALNEALPRAHVATPSKASATAPTKAERARRKILVVDDTDMLLIFVEDSLALADPTLQITSVATGLQGVKEAQRLVPDLALIDYSLPDIKGDEVCRRLAENHTTARIPIIMMSGHVHEMTAAAAKLPNVVATIAKPFLSEALVTLVRQTLREETLPKTSARPKSTPTKVTLKAAPRTNTPAPPPLTPNEVLLDLPLDVVAMQVNTFFQIGSIRARPASPTVSIEIPALAARAALPLQTAFQLGPVELDEAGRLSVVRLIPTANRFRAVETRSAFAIGGVAVVPANERERLQLLSAGNSNMTMQLFAPLQLVSVELSPSLEVRQLVLRCRGNAVRVSLNSNNSRTHSGASFQTTSVQLDDSRHLRELTLAPVN